MGRKREMDLDYTQHDFQFTKNWFRNRNLGTFRKYVQPEWAGKPITYLELGVFEGMSLVWMMQHVLTNDNSRAVACDPHLMTGKLSGELMEEVRQRAIYNIQPYCDRCTLISGNSAEVLRKMLRKQHGFEGINKNSVDLCMIDGNHNSLAVLDDIQLCLQVVKPGGWLLFDDVENDKEKQDHVKQGLAMFLDGNPEKLELLWKYKYMEAYRKA